MWTSPT
ncbi:unnamed protein product [Linum tenue]|nr:unnamed protein product [Linum tenue]